jgi:hypothetical protein
VCFLAASWEGVLERSVRAVGAELLTAVVLVAGLSECAVGRVVVVADRVGVDTGFFSFVVALLVRFLFAEESFAIDIVDALFLIAFGGAACLVVAAGVGLVAGFSMIAASNNSGLDSGFVSGFVSDFSVTVGGCTFSFTARDASFAVTLSTLSPWKAASAVRILWGDGLNGEAEAVSTLSSCPVGDTVADL